MFPALYGIWLDQTKKKIKFSFLPNKNYNRGEVIHVYSLTLSRSLGSLAQSIAEKLSKDQGLALIHREMALRDWLPQVASPHDIHMLRESYLYYHHAYEGERSYKDFLAQKIKAAQQAGPCLFLGMGAQTVLAAEDRVLHLRIDAPLKLRIQRIQTEWKLSTPEAAAIVANSDKRRRRFLKKVYDLDWADWQPYDLVLNTQDMTAPEATSLIRDLLTKRIQRTGTGTGAESPSATSAHQMSLAFDPEGALQEDPFHHDIERTFAAVLDSYGLDWAYEPRTFPLAFDDEGNITQAISPDFYLASDDVYIELTVMKPKYMAEKRRKVEAMRALYPDVQLILLDKRGLRAFMDRLALKQNKE